MNTPPAEVAIDAELAARLVSEQHPDLADGLTAGGLTLVASGWDNTLYRLGDRLVLRLPRRQVAAELILNEHRWLPAIADRISVPIPAPLRLGEPTAYYPWHWTISRWIDGESAAALRPDERDPIAASLAAFMNEVHVPAPSEAPRNPVRGVPLASRAPAVREHLSSGLVKEADKISALWQRLLTVPAWSGLPLWLHGDPHPANVLVNRDRGLAELAAVIDFGDLTGGDPATDLAAGWMLFSPQARAVFRAHLDGVDAATWQRARGWALNMGTSIATNSGDNPRMAAIGAHALEQVLLDE
ncbi:MAG: aminoglycoside phosphotransferase family protein [Nocardiopsaceae bacterium]|jgi:aminoglycoside phosphotransferase (APT) family kinase protein|nr:aminoglycoside phosphotransferase family protein [Nocardiopsaceae bacterium]